VSMWCKIANVRVVVPNELFHEYFILKTWAQTRI